ncbi:MAG: hypothetical protein DYG83_18330 [Candidatus Brocadia sp. AMX2]|uniref:ERCC4 domain-containing protein n=1 Tax=Candidatus Brocadia sinica JPN1 TaxID=1197129 RepID=A0ABQ0K2P7_9BACT|nr:MULTISPECIES: ERCC4 domain-containing protein [Brocadia]MBC6934189.1 hypothetical protein [Candidatus Brocadia sp.]MBL1170681.1 hypothetical protein [Candidatus Brocadia sp. AMX1]NOG42787.1 hypothetical protein [Planctomycetota bacterium]GIK12023.1 MAG: hypothetical protein BroJett002_07300 [Candidatus Brocadia sinica]KAA0240962.1 MAG: hypothetical protein EDM70_18830 [Candidatus Brocadia sp. AMX2]
MIKKSDLVIIQDTREQTPLVFKNATVEVVGLSTGDYSLKNFTDKVTIERKSLSDLLGSLGVGRERFMNEVQRMRAFDYAAIVIETSLSDIYKGKWRSEMTVASVVGSLQALSAKYGVHILFADNPTIAADTVEGLLYHFLRKQHEYLERIKPYLV